MNYSRSTSAISAISATANATGAAITTHRPSKISMGVSHG